MRIQFGETHAMRFSKLAIVLLLSHLVVFGAPKKLSSDLEKADKNKVVEVIFQFDKSLDNVTLAEIRAKFKQRRELLRQIIEPSLKIDEKFF